MSPAFKVGDFVVAKGHPFWLTVARVMPGGYNFQCRFGTSGTDAGVWHASELSLKCCSECHDPLVEPIYDLCRRCHYELKDCELDEHDEGETA